MPVLLIPNVIDQEKVLELLGRIATAQPIVPYQAKAESLLKQIGHPEYTRVCEWCHKTPAYPTTSGVLVCEDCRDNPIQGTLNV